MNFTNIINGNSLENAYIIQDTYIPIFDFKTPIRVKGGFEPVCINEIALSVGLSSKFEYVPGSLNFLNESTTTVQDEAKRRLLLISRMKAFFKCNRPLKRGER